MKVLVLLGVLLCLFACQLTGEFLVFTPGNQTAASFKLKPFVLKQEKLACCFLLLVPAGGQR